MISEVAALLSSPPLSTRCTDNSIEETPSWPDGGDDDDDDYSIIMMMMMMLSGMRRKLYFFPEPGFPRVVGEGRKPNSFGQN